MRLSQSYDSGHMFCGLTQVDSNYFIVFFFKLIFFKKKNQPSTMDLLKIGLYNLF